MYDQIEHNKRKTILLIFVFLLIIIGLGWFLGVYMGYGYGIFTGAILFSIISALTGYFAGDKMALWTTGAKPITPQENPYLYRMVENLCITAGLPLPKIYIIQSPALNAFATGRDPKHASIAFTTGIIESLENEELEGVAAHELSHVQNYDIRVMTIVVVLVGTIALISDLFFRIRLFGGGGDNRDRNTGQIGMVIMLIGVVLLILSPIVAELIKLAISRRREYLADASGALLTRYPEGLARALEKIGASATPLPHASAATAHLFISNPFKKHSISGLFSTHPPIEERIKKLRGMA
ncbi:MAG TPA: M48 family metallopeptidase [Candidatus Kapabacteria bacterium]|nr:M48 family metallopeptidase [Candidatus Kapabacteria bacterium]